MSDVIKGFIEVIDTSNNTRLVNVKHIEEVWDNRTICLNTAFNGGRDYIYCQETYEEIKQKIKEATE